MTKVLITGATGFLGGHAARRLARMGWEVYAMGRSLDAGEKLKRDGIRFIEADLRDAAAVEQACAGQEVVLHCGALSAPWGPYRSFYECNVEATRHVLAGCRKHEVSRLVHISTPSVLFDYHPRRSVREDAPLPQRPANAYAATKLLAEQEVLSACQDGVPALILRPRAIFGPQDRSLFPRLLEANAQGGVPMIGEGQASIDLTYVDNVVDAMVLGCQAGPEALGRAYHISNGEAYTFRELMEKLFAMLAIPLQTRKLPYKVAYSLAALLELVYSALPLKGEPPLTRYTVGSIGVTHTLDISLARQYLGYTPQVSVEEGLRRFADWWVKSC
ncbi:NAD-dependent epimerase/dehydratase family protein [Paenibacillus sanguinis]|uniref:NAD-dependent epimerase/dehydratase family protein n=1 Tax=Paenibacillus sanguinis TaxID=225906 RepID=UPI0003772E69|nr:SDR family NAD(P)-dependent oxidoreductase [Paenibacillus sanguinis]